MAHRHRGGSVLPRTRHGKRGSLIPDQLTERVTGIEHHRASAIDDDLPALASADRALTQPLEIHPDQHHAVRVLAREIGIHECAGNARGGLLAEARRGEQPRDEARQFHRIQLLALGHRYSLLAALAAAVRI